MRTIIAGSRSITDYAVVEEAVAASGFRPSVVLSGAARGVDTLAFDWGWEQGVPVESYPADWKKLGKHAGAIRNQIMAERADALIAVWDGRSRGTADMIAKAKRRGLKVYVHDLSAGVTPGDGGRGE